MFRYVLSWRYLVKRRTNLIAIVGLFLAVGALIMILSIMTGFLEANRSFLRGSLSDVVIAPLFGERSDGTQVREDPEALVELVRADPRVRAASARLRYYGILHRPGYVGAGGLAETAGGVLARTGVATLAAVQLVGVDPPAADGVGSALHANDPSGFAAALAREPQKGVRVADPRSPFRRPPDFPADGPEPVVVGEQLFAALELARGDVLEIVTARPDADAAVEPRRLRFTVAGTFRSGQNDADLSWIYVARPALAAMVGGRSFSEACVELFDYERDGAAFGADVARALDTARMIKGDRRYEVRTWESFEGSLVGAIENQRSLMAIILSLVLLVAGFTVFAILSMMVREKRRDVGILTALGATPGGLVSLFLLISLWDVMLGAASGALVGTWAALEIDAIERGLSSVLGVDIINRDMYLFDTIPSRVQPEAVALVLVGTLVAALLAALVPAWSASRLDPLQAVRLE